MHCYVCEDCKRFTADYNTLCYMCGSSRIYYDRYGTVRRLIAECLSTLTAEEVTTIALITGCQGIGHNEMYYVIGKLIN